MNNNNDYHGMIQLKLSDFEKTIHEMISKEILGAFIARTRAINTIREAHRRARLERFPISPPDIDAEAIVDGYIQKVTDAYVNQRTFKNEAEINAAVEKAKDAYPGKTQVFDFRKEYEK
jgi:hypothetical protein